MLVGFDARTTALSQDEFMATVCKVFGRRSALVKGKNAAAEMRALIPASVTTCLSGCNLNKEAGVFFTKGWLTTAFFDSFLFLIDVFIERTVKPKWPRSQPYQQVNDLHFVCCFVMLAEVSLTSYIILYNH